jgi:hypothetical protein
MPLSGPIDDHPPTDAARSTPARLCRSRRTDPQEPRRRMPEAPGADAVGVRPGHDRGIGQSEDDRLLGRRSGTPLGFVRASLEAPRGTARSRSRPPHGCDSARRRSDARRSAADLGCEYYRAMRGRPGPAARQRRSWRCSRSSRRASRRVAEANGVRRASDLTERFLAAPTRRWFQGHWNDGPIWSSRWSRGRGDDRRSTMSWWRSNRFSAATIACGAKTRWMAATTLRRRSITERYSAAAV